jgi:hypothetical protein
MLRVKTGAGKKKDGAAKRAILLSRVWASR